MRLTTNKTKNGTSFYVIRSVKRDGKRSSELVEKLGTDTEIMSKYNCSDPYEWAKKHVDELNAAEASQNKKVLIPFNTDKLIPMDQQNSFNAGYLFLQKIYYGLKLPKICAEISGKYNFKYDLDSILSRLIYNRILFPSSKLSCFEQAGDLLEQPDFELHQIYRALSVIAQEDELIQSRLYDHSTRLVKRSPGVLYYDCTNYYFESEMQEGLKQYGPSKEHRPNPIVQMGLFMDHDGIPLAFSITEGNRNEQTTLRPLEEQILRDFPCSNFIVCTDAGLSSLANRKFNNYGGRRFITAQSIKSLTKKYRDQCLDPSGWHLSGSKEEYNLNDLDSEKDFQKCFFKEIYVEGYDEEQDISFNQTLLVTFSLKYRNYQRKIRAQQIERAKKAIENSPAKLDKKNQNDFRRMIRKTAVTADGEIADKKVYEINEDVIRNEEQYDGFYAVFHNLDDEPEEIIAVNKRRWEIEESFRIMKTEFEARPVYLKRDDRIRAHFMTCFISLLIYRILEKQLSEDFTCDEIIQTLRKMRLTQLGKEGYIPSYTRTQLTDRLHENAGFRTDYELITPRSMRGIISKSKK